MLRKIFQANGDGTFHDKSRHTNKAEMYYFYYRTLQIMISMRPTMSDKKRKVGRIRYEARSCGRSSPDSSAF